MPRGACPATAVWHTQGDGLAGALARRKSGSPIGPAHQQRGTPTAHQNVLPISLAPWCGGGAACRPELFFGLCGPAKCCNSVHGQRPAGILKGVRLSGPANAVAAQPQADFLIDGAAKMMTKNLFEEFAEVARRSWNDAPTPTAAAPAPCGARADSVRPPTAGSVPRRSHAKSQLLLSP